MTRIIAHRGLGFVACENSLSAIRRALERPGLGLEMDLHLTADGEVVIVHDHHLARGGPLVEGTNLATLRGHLTDDERRGGQLPTLDDVLDLWTPKAEGRTLMLEMKTSPEYEETRTDPGPLALAIARILDRRPLRAGVIVKAFDWRGLPPFAALTPWVERFHLTFPTSPIPRVLPDPVARMLRRVWEDTAIWGGDHAPAGPDDVPAAIRAAGGAGWSAYHLDLNEATVSRARRHGLQVAAWTVNAAVDMERLRALDIDFLVTDHWDLALRETTT